MSAHISAGVYWREIDLSNYVPALSSTQYGIVGTASKGPINDRTLITNVNQLVQTFGYQNSTFPAIDAAMQYLTEGNQLWFVRVQASSAPADVATSSVTLSNSTNVTISAKDAGTYYNDISIDVLPTNPKNVSSSTLGDGTEVTFALSLTAIGELVPGTISLKLNDVTVANDNGSGVFVEVGTTTFVSGTVNYSTGAVSVTFASAPLVTDQISALGQFYSTFSMSFNKVISGTTYAIETYKNLTLISTSSSYYATVLSRSNIIEVPVLTAAPVSGSYNMSGGTDGTTGILDSDYIGINTGTSSTGLQLLSNAESVDINSLSVPGISSNAVVQSLISIAETRRDCIAIIDPPQGLTPELVVDWIDGNNTYSANNSINSSFAAVYYPWVNIYDSYNSESRYVAPSGFVAAAFARTDVQADIFYAPAGAARGKLLGTLGVERQLSQGERDFLYENRVNPINDFAATGIVLWGQKTTQVASSTLDRINARRILNYIEKVCVTAAQPLVFEPNNLYTWSRLTSMIQPYLDSLVKKGALYEARIVCDKVTNTSDVIDRNEMVANIFLKITKTAEVITLNFVLLSTGANIDEYIGRTF